MTVPTLVGGLHVREATGPDLDRWDDIVRRFANHRVVHLRAWVESLETSGRGRPVYLVFERDGETVACLPGLVTTVAGLRLFGSPLSGWQTVSMGPAFDPARVSTADLLAATVQYLERHHHVAHIELMHSGLDPDSMRALGFEGQAVPTYRAPLFPGDPDRAFRAMKDSARRNVRRAERLGLVVRFCEDERFVDEHYAQLCEVFQRGGHAIPFSRQRVLECFRHLKAAGALLAPAVYLPAGRTSIATGMFLIEGTELLLWGWAHLAHYRWYRPTELMTWTVMQQAMRAGCEQFDFMGAGEFKAKFGAEPDLTKWRWMRSRPGWLLPARHAAESAFRWQQAVRGRTARFAARAGAMVMPRAHTGHDLRASACVLGDVDLVRALGLAGVPCTIVAPRGDASRYSRFVRAAVEWMDPWERPDDLVEALVEHGTRQPEPPVLFYQDDAALLLVARHAGRLRQAFRFVVPDAALVEQLVDKARFHTLAARLGLPVPPTQALFPGDEPYREDVGIDYPMLLKPLTRRPEQWEPIAGAGKAVRLEGPEALRALWPRLATAHLPVLAQSLIPGPETQIESYHVYVDERGERVAYFTGRKIRTRPAAFGDTTALEITDAPDVAEVGQDIVRRLALTGVAKLDFKRGPDGRLHLLEVNPRFTLWHHAGAVAGVNIPALVHGDLVHQPRPPRTFRARAGVRWCKVWSDWPMARAGGVPFLQWLLWAAGCEALSAFAWDDPMPLIGAGWARGMARLARPAAARPRPPQLVLRPARPSGGHGP